MTATILFLVERVIIGAADQSDWIPQFVVGFLPIALFLLVLFFLFRQQFSSTATKRDGEQQFSWRGIILIAVALALILLAVLFRGRGERPSEAEKTQVITAMESMYAAAMHDDLDKWHTVAASDFYAFDNGKRFDGDALMELIKKLHDQGRIYQWTVNEPEVRIAGNMAWITYVNRGSVQDGSGKNNMSWLESAVLRKGEDGWRIQFFHSTRVP